mmetsp:Transcript_19352/g.34830  ORF Transcript_19352/g.34830 Transcript_19352/m.34830 type:complete len:85 (+) Transcript_19352:267-521(+)
METRWSILETLVLVEDTKAWKLEHQRKSRFLVVQCTMIDDHKVYIAELLHPLATVTGGEVSFKFSCSLTSGRGTNSFRRTEVAS